MHQVDRLLLTPYGLRTLSPESPDYRGHYGGDQRSRDASYHQGTVWPWLLGAYVDAGRRTGRSVATLRRLLAQVIGTIEVGGLGSIGEIFEGDPPHNPRGCIAQAWSVGEVLRAWRRVAQD